MKILFIGDVVGQPGRRAVAGLLPGLIGRHALDFVIANGENSAGGAGITSKTAAELFSTGVDVITTGDHVWDQKEVIDVLPNEKRILRPANYPPGAPGWGSIIVEKQGLPAVAVLELQGRTFMPAIENPFAVAAQEVPALRQRAKIVFVDMHAEATSEKIAIARMLDGQASAVVWTHTHVQTADEQIFPGGTAFLCDAGFTGPHDGVIGRTLEPVLRHFLTNLPQRFDVADGDIRLQGVIVTVQDASGRATDIRRVSESLATPRVPASSAS